MRLLNFIMSYFSRKKPELTNIDTAPDSERECICCFRALDDGDECTCMEKDDLVLDMGNGVTHKHRGYTNCTHWNCSYCH
jgi:hypothetical protein